MMAFGKRKTTKKRTSLLLINKISGLEVTDKHIIVQEQNAIKLFCLKDKKLECCILGNSAILV
jgi:hypothetical protein